MPDPEPLDPRLTERRNPRTAGIDRADPREIVELIQAEDRTVPDAVAREADALAAMIRDVSGRMREDGRLFYVGAGTSGRLGVLDAAECPPTFGTDPGLVQGIIAGGREALVRSREGAEDDRGAGRAAVRDAGVGPDDFVLGIATSGTTPYVRAAVLEAAEIGAGTGFLSCTPPPEEMREAADHLVTPLVGPEVITGSTRMKAGTATKLALNTLSTGVMVRLGKVYGNLMVDLRAVSRKLVERSIRIVREITGAGAEEARRTLVKAGGSAKTAVAMRRLGVGRAMAERLLDAADGFLGEVLERWDGAESTPYYGCYGQELAPGGAVRVLDDLREGPERLERALEEARRIRRDGREPGTGALGGWTAAEHLAHLAACEGPAFRGRVEAVASAGTGRPPTFADWEPTDPPPDADAGTAELLRRFGEERGRTVELLEGLSPDDWDRRAVVAGEEVALHQLLRGMAHHDRAHAERVSQWVHPDLLRRREGDAGEGRAGDHGEADGPGRAGGGS